MERKYLDVVIKDILGVENNSRFETSFSTSFLVNKIEIESNKVQYGLIAFYYADETSSDILGYSIAKEHRPYLKLNQLPKKSPDEIFGSDMIKGCS